MIAAITFLIGFIIGWFMSSQHWKYLLEDKKETVEDLMKGYGVKK